MASTLYVNPLTWDLDIDVNGNIAVATGPYALAQDAAGAIKTFAGEVYYDKTLGIDHLKKILGHSPSIALLKALFEAAALTVPGIVSAAVVITSLTGRTVAGQVRVTDSTGATASASF